MPRVYRPEESEGNSVESPGFLKGFIRMEILFGALLMTVGGFVVRANGDYSLVVVGLTLAGLGTYRLIRTYERKQDSRFLDEDRVLNKLRYHFDANYSVAVDYELPDGQVVPYLVLGPPGVLLFERWDRPGRVEERNGTWRREHEEKVTEHPNPRKKNNERVESVRDHL